MAYVVLSFLVQNYKSHFVDKINWDFLSENYRVTKKKDLGKRFRKLTYKRYNSCL